VKQLDGRVDQPFVFVFDGKPGVSLVEADVVVVISGLGVFVGGAVGGQEVGEMAMALEVVVGSEIELALVVEEQLQHVEEMAVGVVPDGQRRITAEPSPVPHYSIQEWLGTDYWEVEGLQKHSASPVKRGGSDSPVAQPRPDPAKTRYSGSSSLALSLPNPSLPLSSCEGAPPLLEPQVWGGKPSTLPCGSCNKPAQTVLDFRNEGIYYTLHVGRWKSLSSHPACVFYKIDALCPGTRRSVV